MLDDEVDPILLNYLGLSLVWFPFAMASRASEENPVKNYVPLLLSPSAPFPLSNEP